MEENDANKANYEELGEHIKLLSARAANNMLTPEGLQDLEDYYERALQMRMMQNSTLTEELKAKENENAQLKKEVVSVHATVKYLFMLAIATSIFFGCVQWPETVVPVVESAYELVAYPPVLIAVTLFVRKRL